MKGSVLWANAGTVTRELFIRLACDADIRHTREAQLGSGGDVRRMETAAFGEVLTVAQALEVLK